MPSNVTHLCPPSPRRHDPDRILDDVAAWLATRQITPEEVLSWPVPGPVSPACREIAARMAAHGRLAVLEASR